MKKNDKKKPSISLFGADYLKKLQSSFRFLHYKTFSRGIFFLILATFVFIATLSISLSSEGFRDSVKKVLVGSDKKSNEVLPDLPVFVGEKDFPVISAQAVLAIDLPSQVPLYEKDPDKKLLPASTTKIMTALVALNYYRDDDILVVDGINSPGQKLGLGKGERYKAISLIEATLIYSANDAAETLAKNYIGGEEAFVERMNDKAREMRLTNSHFENVVGYDSLNHYSTARDLVRVAEVAMRDPKFAAIVSTKSKVINDLDGKRTFTLNSTNELLGKVEGVVGVKTGWTENARENLVTYVERDGKKVLIAVLGSSDRFGETRELIDWIFSNYEWQKVQTPY